MYFSLFDFYHCHIFTLLAFFFFFNDTATTEIYTLSLHDALPISRARAFLIEGTALTTLGAEAADRWLLALGLPTRSEEHTSELQSRSDLVCRLLLEKKKTNQQQMTIAKRS